VTTNQTLWLDQDALRVGNRQLVATNGGVGIGTVFVFGALTAAGTNGSTAATFFGNVGIGTGTPMYAVDVRGQLNSNNYQSDPAGVVQTYAQTISSPFTVPSGRNAMSVGNITVAVGASVTVQPGSRWVVI